MAWLEAVGYLRKVPQLTDAWPDPPQLYALDWGEPSRLVHEGYRPRQHISHEVPERKAEEREAEYEEESEEGDMLDAPGSCFFLR